MRTALEPENTVTAFDCASGFGAGYVEVASQVRTALHQVQPDVDTFRPPVAFITFSSQETNTLNDRFQAEQRRAQTWRHVALLGANNRFYQPLVRDNTPLVSPDFATQDVPSTFDPSKTYRPWSLAVGDYVALTGNMIDLHAELASQTDFLDLWQARFCGNANAMPKLRKLVNAKEDCVANGDTGMVVQLYVFNPKHKCSHVQAPPPPPADDFQSSGRSHRQGASGGGGGGGGGSNKRRNTASNQPPPASYYCERCSRQNSICDLAGPTFAVTQLVGGANKELMRSWNVASDQCFLVAVIWMDGTDELVHVPIPAYDYRKIRPGYALTFFRAQGSQWNNVAFVCSNNCRPQGSSSRNAYQKRLERERAKNTIGTYKIDGYWNNRRLFYVAATRARLRTMFIFNLEFRTKLVQLMEHDQLPPNLMEDLFSGEFVPDEKLLVGMPKTAETLLETTLTSPVMTLSSPSPIVAVAAFDDSVDDDWLMSVDLEAIEQTAAKAKTVSNQLAAGVKRPHSQQ